MTEMDPDHADGLSKVGWRWGQGSFAPVDEQGGVGGRTLVTYMDPKSHPRSVILEGLVRETRSGGAEWNAAMQVR